MWDKIWFFNFKKYLFFEKLLIELMYKLNKVVFGRFFVI